MHAQLESTAAEDYLAAEACSDVRHEFVRGQVYAMTGGSLRHNSIALAIAARLRKPARHEHCRVAMSDLKVHIPVAVPTGRRKLVGDVYYYPDVVVSCEPTDESSQMFVAPCLIVEVTSPSTAGIDKIQKFVPYRQLPSLQCFLLVAQSSRMVDCYTRAATAGEWRLQTFEGSGAIELPCPRMQLTLDEIYEDVADDE